MSAQVSLISADSLLAKINNNPAKGEITVINFWATWCKPCIQELPYFKEADSILRNKNVRFIFVAFDGPSEIRKVKKIVRSKKMIGTQYLLNEVDLNNFINQVDPKWMGNIPYSIILKNNKRTNHEYSFENLNTLLLLINE